MKPDINKQWHEVVEKNENRAIMDGKFVVHTSLIFDTEEGADAFANYLRDYNRIYALTDSDRKLQISYLYL